jgi:hypothetical protein
MLICGIAGGITCSLNLDPEIHVAWTSAERHQRVKSPAPRGSGWTKLLLTRPLSASGFSLRLPCFPCVFSFPLSSISTRTQHGLPHEGPLYIAHSPTLPRSFLPLLSLLHVLWPQSPSPDKGVRKSTRQQCRSFSKLSGRSTYRGIAPQWPLTCHPSAV